MNSLVLDLGRRMVGYRADVLRLLVCMVLAGRNVLLLGRHGIGKSTLAALLARFLGGKWVHYYADRDDLTMVAGLPSAKDLAAGKLNFLDHGRAIWDKDVVLIDELTRATPENQNLWLEIVEQKTLYGKPLRYRALIATCNPEYYAASRELDVALLDRFFVVIELPDFQALTEVDIEAIVLVNIGCAAAGSLSLSEGRLKGDPVRAFEAERARVLSIPRLHEAVACWVARLLTAISKAAAPGQSPRAYLSPRTFGRHLPNVLLDLCALEAAMGSPLSVQSLSRLAGQAAEACLQKKCSIDRGVLERALEYAGVAFQRGLAFAPPDRLSEVAAGSVRERVAAFRRLDLSALDPAERARLDLAARKLVQEVVALETDPEPAADLWFGLAALPEVRLELERALLREKLEILAAASGPNGYSSRSRRLRTAAIAAERARAADPRNWSPEAPRWTRGR